MDDVSPLAPTDVGSPRAWVTFRELCESKLEQYDLVLARITSYASDRGTADFIKCYRRRYIFAPQERLDEPIEVPFSGMTGSWADPRNQPGDTALLFLGKAGGRFYEHTWHGHLTLFEVDGQLMCLIPNITTDLIREVPDNIARSMCTPSVSRLLNGGPADTLVPFAELEAYLIELIADLDGSVFEPVMLKPEPLAQHLVPRQSLPAVPIVLQPKTAPAPPPAPEPSWLRRLINKVL